MESNKKLQLVPPLRGSSLQLLLYDYNHISLSGFFVNPEGMNTIIDITKKNMFQPRRGDTLYLVRGHNSSMMCSVANTVVSGNRVGVLVNRELAEEQFFL